MKKWVTYERDTAKEFEGQQTIASGSLWFQKGDIETEDFIIDTKTRKKSFSINSKKWKEFKLESWMKEKEPLYVIKFDNGEEVIVCNKNLFLSLIESGVSV